MEQNIARGKTWENASAKRHVRIVKQRSPTYGVMISKSLHISIGF